MIKYHFLLFIFFWRGRGGGIEQNSRIVDKNKVMNIRELFHISHHVQLKLDFFFGRWGVGAKRLTIFSLKRTNEEVDSL